MGRRFFAVSLMGVHQKQTFSKYRNARPATPGYTRTFTISLLFRYHHDGDDKLYTQSIHLFRLFYLFRHHGSIEIIRDQQSIPNS